MSSANLVEVIYVKETEYGVTPDPLSGVTAETPRFTSETLSGTPITTTSTLIRTDRMSSGQVVTGLEVGGDISTELTASQFNDDFFEAALMSSWVASASISTDVTLTPNPSDDQEATLTITGDFSTIGPGVAVNDVLQLIPVSGPCVTVTVISVDSTTECTVATKAGEAAIVSQSMTVAIPSYVEIGAKQQSMSISKAYLDVLHELTADEHSQRYKGSLVGGFNLTATYGEIVSQVYSTMGSDYLQEEPSLSQQIETAGGTVNPAATSAPLNASVDVPILAADGTAATYCIESFDITLNNNLDPSNCIGKAAPEGYTLGNADVAVNASIYLSDSSYDAFMAQKMTQEPVSLTFTMANADGGYAIYLAAIQLSFPDPASTGQNDQTMLEASGVGKVGENGESAIKVYKLLGDQ